MKAKVPTTRRSKKVVAVDSATDLYRFAFNVNGEDLMTETADPALAYEALKGKVIKTKVKVSVEFQGKRAEKYILGARQTRMIIGNKLRAEFFTKNLLLSLK